ncbi:Low affinity iron permease [Aspergillus brunneoviolaceus CBS 621.78]|uniref:Low affinity iron permease n=1 Tax=Aspergillus brunneoviolaceus CBS 621.78 TaxID=1450534 RepID=A0ACD1GEI0_9EURO|nr:Low affinity iron permease [Aspergillus brunneoviolaceus CBS 621.78]RAH47575.1 Low affinity iron permease [Aspergillus brunneoviolaceus CBS 621.78]
MNYFTPVLRCEVEGNAETQWLGSGMDAKMDMSDNPSNEVTGFRVRRSPRLVDRCLNVMVRISGSVPVFFVILAGLLTWALLGIRFGNLSIWIASISDVQAILCYVFDSFIMRQLLRQYSEQRDAIVELRSRSHSHQRMLANIKRKLGQDGIHQVAEKCNVETFEPKDYSLHSQGPLARGIMHSARAFGHVLSSLLFWVCVVIWLGFGPHCSWSDRWQLYINDATSALMILVFAFLACLRERYADYSSTSLDAIFRLDSTLEMKLRCLTKDDLPNPMVADPPPKENILQVVIFYYADIVGTLVGLVFLVLVVIAWAAVGPVLHYDSNWWLLIGTYAGLVGLFDSLVLRNVQSKANRYIKRQMTMVLSADAALLTELSLATDNRAGSSAQRPSLSQRVSRRMDAVTSHVLMVMAGFLLTIGCVVTSSAMKWSLTGQLISNVPPSIIETFFMLILINGQNDAEASVHGDLDDLYHRRQRLLSFTQHAKELLEVHGQSDIATMAAS